MKFNKSSVALLLMLLLSTGLFASSFEKLPDCRLAELNQQMQTKLTLSKEQMQSISQLNQAYCSSRTSILNNPEKVGKNTALLACWDRWVQGLFPVLTDVQMQKFMQWQSQVDLVGEAPF